MFIKTGTKHASKDEIELAVHKVELLLAVLVLGLRLVVLLLGHCVGYE